MPRTQSGKDVTIGTGSGTKWKQYKRDHAEEFEGNKLSEALIESIVLALQNGYNHVDTAEAYDTHFEVAEAIKRSGVPREDLWITDKFIARGSDSGPYESIKNSLKELQLEYLDLYLLHGPKIDPSKSYTLEDAWLQLEKAHYEGLVKNIGVSNHAVEHLERIAKVGKITPFANQIEFHPYLQDQNPGVVAYCKEHKILIESYGSLTPLFRATDGPLKTLLPKLTEKYSKTDAQILLRWAYQYGTLPVTTSSKLDRIRESLEIYNFQLDPEDQKSITDVGAGFGFRFANFAKA